jgi:hypothetical protein
MQTIHVCNHTTLKPCIPSMPEELPSASVMRPFLAHWTRYSPAKRCAFCNDHDPLPLLAQLQDRYGAHLSIEYKQRETGAIVIDFTVVG